jgi:type IV pilus assembly protein PilF
MALTTPTDMMNRSHRPQLRALFGVAALAGLVIVGACTTTTTGDYRPPPEPAEAGKRAQMRVELASNYFERGQNQVALDEVKLALDASPNYAPAYSLRGLIYGANGEVALAEENFQRAIQLDGRDGGTMHNFGWFLCQQGRYPQAHTQFQNAVSLPTYRDNQRTLLAQGVCFAREGKLNEAESTLSRAYEVDASNPVVAYNLADVLYRRAEFERARFYMRRINQSDSYSNAQTLWLAARIEHKMGNKPGANTFGNQLRTRFPQAPETVAFERGRFDE